MLVELKFHPLKQNQKRKDRTNIETFIEALDQKRNNPEFLLKKEWAIETVKFRLNLIDLRLSAQYNRKVIQNVEHRIKTAESIARKLARKGYAVTFENALTKLNDIAGIRVICLYSDDVYQIAAQLKQQNDFILIKEKDYIKTPKKSGYQSFHLIVDLPFSYDDKTELQRIEIQIRTVAMDFWAGVDNHICYKKSPEEIKKSEHDLKTYSAIISDMDKQMLELRKKAERM